MSFFQSISRLFRATLTTPVSVKTTTQSNPSATSKATSASVKPAQATDLPWMAEAKKLLGKHETTDNGFLKKWLGSDGHALGDPSKLPWCGDFVETCIRLSLPQESVPNNPYLALNWSKWANYLVPEYGCVMSFHNGDQKKTSGHVGFYVGESVTHYYILGGNQGNKVSIMPIPKARLRANGSRWPLNGPESTGSRPKMSGGTTVSVF